MIRTIRAIFFILVLCVLTASFFFTIIWISPPAPLSSDAPATDFSASRAMQDLEVIAREPHPLGISPAHAEVRDYLLEEIRAFGLEPQVQNAFALYINSPGALVGGPVENILVRLPGTDPEGAILLMSHYDSTPGGPGAVDSGSGVVTILELLRALQAGSPLRQDVIIFFSDGEEPGTLGAHAFVEQHPWFKDVRLAINVDQFWVGPPMLVRFSQGNGMLIQALAHGASSTRLAHISFPFDLFPSGDTDLSPFVLAGVLGAEINGGGPFPEKHTALDLPKIIDPGSLQQAGDQLLALVRELGNQSTLETSTPDQTFFPLMGMLVHYPSDLAWPMAMIAGVCFLAMILIGFHTKGLTWRGLGLGFLLFLLSLVLNVVIANLIWKSILAFHPEYAYISSSQYRQKLSSDFLYAVGLFVLALAMTTSLMVIARKKVAALDLAAGALVIWFPLMIATTIMVPATSYLFTWILLTCSLTLLLALIFRSRKGAWFIFGLTFLASAILAIFLWMPLFYVAILAGPMSPDTQLLSMMIGLAALWMGSMTPMLDWITSLRRWLFPAFALVAALGLLLAGHFLVGKDSPPPLVNSIGYWLDANNGHAYWIAFSDVLDERQANLLVNPVRQPYTELFSEAPHLSVLTAAAPKLEMEGPYLEVLANDWINDRRVVRARVTASLHERILVRIPKGPPLLSITVQDNERTELPAVGDRGWWLRFEGIPVEGIEMTFEFLGAEPVQFLLVEEKTGLPSFPGLQTQPEPGTMKSPGVFTQAIPTDFTAIYRNYDKTTLENYAESEIGQLVDQAYHRNANIRLCDPQEVADESSNK